MKRVLVVEDELDVTTAADGEEGLAKINEGGFLSLSFSGFIAQ